jgi:hypothetical protein
LLRSKSGGTATRLHPITKLILFAVGIQLAAEAIEAAYSAADYARIFPHGYYGSDAYDRWIGPRLAARIERDVGSTFMGLADAILVEMASRFWRRLRDERLASEGLMQ